MSYNEEAFHQWAEEEHILLVRLRLASSPEFFAGYMSTYQIRPLHERYIERASLVRLVLREENNDGNNA